MKIYEQYVPYETKFPKVIAAQYIGDFAIRIRFDDGHEKLVDFKSFIFGSSNPDMEKFQSESYFQGFEIDRGNINWYEHEMIFPLKSLYEGKL